MKILAASEYKLPADISVIGILPLESCFDCDKMRASELRQLSKQKKILLVYPTARRIVQEKTKKNTALKITSGVYIFDDTLYQMLYDKRRPKGYFISVR